MARTTITIDTSAYARTYGNHPRDVRPRKGMWAFTIDNAATVSVRYGTYQEAWHGPRRKRSLGTASDKGNHWVERILSLKETCRLHTRATYAVLVDAVTSFFSGQQPDLSWINAGMSTAAHPL